MKFKRIRKIIRDGYQYIIVPKTFKDTPIELPDFIKQDDVGNDIVGQYYTLREIHQHFQKQFTFVKVSNTKFIAFRWDIDCGDLKDFKTFFKANNLVNMRATVNNVRLKLKDIDFVNLTGNEFGIFNKLKFKKIPKPATSIE